MGLDQYWQVTSRFVRCCYIHFSKVSWRWNHNTGLIQCGQGVNRDYSTVTGWIQGNFQCKPDWWWIQSYRFQGMESRETRRCIPTLIQNRVINTSQHQSWWGAMSHYWWWTGAWDWGTVKWSCHFRRREIRSSTIKWWGNSKWHWWWWS